MSVSNIRNGDIPSVHPTDAIAHEALAKQYGEHYQQLFSQYEAALNAWSDVDPEAKTRIGESMCLAVDKHLTETKGKLDAFRTALSTSETSEGTLKALSEALGTSVNHVTASVAAAATSTADSADVSALKKIWESLSDADKALLGTEFTRAMEAKFAAFNETVAELQKAIEEGASSSVIEALQAKLSELKMQLSAFIQGTADGSVMSLTDRIDCLKSLENAKANKSVDDEEYATLRRELLLTDVSKQISKEKFKTQLDEIISGTIQKEAKEYVKKAEIFAQHMAAQNELFKNNITLKVMQEKNNFLEFKLDAEAEENLQEKAEFNPQVKRLIDEGRWQMPKMTRQQEITIEQIRNERHFEDRMKNEPTR